jgi:hypothetical protein
MIWVTLSDGVPLERPETIMNNSLAAEDGVGLVIVLKSTVVDILAYLSYQV